MNEMRPVNLRAFRQKARKNKSRFRRFLTRIENAPPRGLKSIVQAAEQEVWKETDCLSCANCCKTMTPTFQNADIKRISAYLELTPAEFKTKYLRREKTKDGDWLNKSEPCQFLSLEDNKCTIYDVRPRDCAGYPHLAKNMKDYMHVYKQNLELCPAAFRLVEKMMDRIR
jgi:Fe-S-cluster containining protein